MNHSDRTTIVSFARQPDSQRLTWVPGTIRDYESLFLIVHRVAYLNGLCKADFVRDFCSGTVRSDFSTLLLNRRWREDEKPLVDIKRLARGLDEQESRFHYSTAEAFHGWARSLFLPYLRLCPICLCSGYHTVLFSLKLLQRCPLHNVPLYSKCACGRAIPNGLEGRMFGVSPGWCPCRRVRYASPGQMREPSLKGPFPALDELVQWLEVCSHRIFVDRKILEASDSNDNMAILRRDSEWWSQWLNMPLPAAINTQGICTGEGTVGSVVEEEFRCGLPQSKVPLPHENSYYCREMQTCMRRYQKETRRLLLNVLRHVRRHLLGDGRRWIAEFAARSDAEYIADRIQHDLCARRAFAFMLWGQYLTNEISLRRWFHTSWSGSSDIFWMETTELKPFVTAPEGLNNSAESQWIHTHVMGTVLWTAWQKAVALVTEMCKTGDIRWGRGVLQEAVLAHWSATRSTTGKLTLHIVKSSCENVPPLQMTDKSRRRNAEQVRRNIIVGQCKAPCLYLDEYGYWTLKYGDSPDPDSCDKAWKKHRLFGVKGQVEFMVFSQNGSCVARSFQPAIMALGCSRQEAISQLREMVRDHQRIIPDSVP